MFTNGFGKNDIMCCWRMQYSRVYKVAGAFDEFGVRLD